LAQVVKVNFGNRDPTECIGLAALGKKTRTSYQGGAYGGCRTNLINKEGDDTKEGTNSKHNEKKKRGKCRSNAESRGLLEGWVKESDGGKAS